VAALVQRTPSPHRREQSRTCLIVGAGSGGRALARELRRNRDLGLSPVGFLDDHLGRRRRSIIGLPVLGTTADLARVAATSKAQAVIVAIPSLPDRDIRRLCQLAAAEGLAVRYLPTFGEALERVARASDLEHLSVDRLLAREEHHVIRPESRVAISGKRVLVTGAGGSIGSELCAQLRALSPAEIVLLDHDESNLHRLKVELDGETLLDTSDVIIADIRDRVRIKQIFAERRPEVVFHSAAHKHLPLLERHPCEGVKANVLGTRILVESAIEAGAERFVLISTDKAASPTSILGATKRVAEMILGDHATAATRFASVRFGNVLGSRGSFLSVLAEQIENGEAVTVTHADVERFFMTIEEAAGLVIEASAMAEFGEVFVLDMGAPVRIVDLVARYAKQLHLDIADVEVRYTGLRPGEKLSEQLFSADEDQRPTAHPKISVARPRTVPTNFQARVDDLIAAAEDNQFEAVRCQLARILPAFEPASLTPSPVIDTIYPDGF
jgi:FlaA1/EpsC-like NDP-sugar epimerase